MSIGIGTKLENEYGTWTIVDVTHYAGSKWYDLKGERGHVVAYPSQIGTHYKVIIKQGEIMKRKSKDCPLSKLTQKEKEEINARTRARLGPDWETTREEVAKRWGI